MNWRRNVPESPELIKNGDHLFTIFCRYNDSVRVSQLTATGPEEAIAKWVYDELPKLDGIGNRLTPLTNELLLDKPALIQGCRNAWAAAAFPIWLDLVQTC